MCDVIMLLLIFTSVVLAESQRAGPTAYGMRLPEAAEDRPPSVASTRSQWSVEWR